MSEPDLFSRAERDADDKPSRARRAAARPDGDAAAHAAPLAERMRPHSLEEYVGQHHLVGPGRLIQAMMQGKKLHSLLLWGPPGTGKTTLARLLAESLGLPFAQLSAVLSGVKDLRAIVERAELELAATGRATVVFIDEIHRFNKAQQDALLPHVERGTIIMIGATTENPSFEVIAPLLSRSRVLTLEPLDEAALGTLIDRALAEPERGLGRLGLALADDARAMLIAHAQGDARVALGTLEVAAEIAARTADRRITVERVAEAAQRRALRYDRQGEEHYNVISAFIKSMRGSDPDAALYYLVRMLEAGEDPLFIARRMVIFAAEDVGNADPRALQVAISVKDAVHFVGLPEGRIPLAQGVTYLATAPKSNASYAALGRVTEEVRASGTLPVPLHLRNAPTGLMRSLGYGAAYQYPHAAPEHFVAEQYLPDELRGRRWYEPGTQGEERDIAQRLAGWRAASGARRSRE
jgi:putative ATPase